MDQKSIMEIFQPVIDGARGFKVANASKYPTTSNGVVFCDLEGTLGDSSDALNRVDDAFEKIDACDAFQQSLNIAIPNASHKYLHNDGQTAFICQFLENLGQLKIVIVYNGELCYSFEKGMVEFELAPPYMISMSDASAGAYSVYIQFEPTNIVKFVFRNDPPESFANDKGLAYVPGSADYHPHSVFIGEVRMDEQPHRENN